MQFQRATNSYSYFLLVLLLVLMLILNRGSPRAAPPQPKIPPPNTPKRTLKSDFLAFGDLLRVWRIISLFVIIEFEPAL